MEEIYHLLTIKTASETLYNALTTEEGLSNWWFPETGAKAKVGHVNTFKVGSNGLNKMKILDLKKDKRVEWECINDDPDDEWKGTRITFDITSDANSCILRFRHKGWKEKTPFFGNCNYHWARHLIMLKHYCETGESIIRSATERKIADIALKNL